MSILRRRAIWLAAAVSALAFATAGSAQVVPDARTTDSGRTGVHHVIADHDAIVPARLLADRSPLDLRHEHSWLLLLTWGSALGGSARLARTAGRAMEVGARRAGSTVSLRQRFDRGPPARTVV